MPHEHKKFVQRFTKEDLLSLEYTYGGEIRVQIEHGDGTTELVLLNNLLGIISRFASDALGNKHGGYMIIPRKIWAQLREEASDRLGRENFKQTKDKGFVGILSNWTIYLADVVQVFIRTDHNGLCWAFDIGSIHNLLRRPEILQLVGEGVGFDDKFVFHPLLGGYAPPLVLRAWADDGYKPALDALEILQIPEKACDLAKGIGVHPDWLAEHAKNGYEPAISLLINPPDSVDRNWRIRAQEILFQLVNGDKLGLLPEGVVEGEYSEVPSRL